MQRAPDSMAARTVRRLAPLLFVALVVAVFAAVIDPGRLAGALGRVSIGVLALVLALSVGYYALQGLRWHLLLRDSGVRGISVADTELLNLAGQATGLLPLGELTRAALVSEVFGAPFGAIVATITVQELLYMLLVMILAVPGARAHPAFMPLLGIAAAATCAILAVLSVPRIFGPAVAALRRTPLLHRVAGQAEALHLETRAMLGRPTTWAWSILGLLGALCSVTTFWLILRELGTGLSWTQAAFVFGLASLAGMASLTPGGLGGFEVGTVTLLALLGVDHGGAVAAALLQRAADKGLATIGGVVALAYARGRYPVLRDRSLRRLAEEKSQEDEEGERPPPDQGEAPPNA